MKKTLLCSALLAALMSVAGGAQAALVSQAGGVVLDNVNNLLWFTDSTDRDFNSAASWAAGLTTGGLSAGSWGITTRNQFYLLAAAAGSTPSAPGAGNATLNALGIPNGTFWTSDIQAAAQSQVPNWMYGEVPDQPQFIDVPQSNFTVMNQNYNVGDYGYGVIDIGYGSLAVASYTAPAPSAVPIPAAAWLMASGLGALGFSARKRKARQA